MDGDSGGCANATHAAQERGHSAEAPMAVTTGLGGLAQQQSKTEAAATWQGDMGCGFGDLMRAGGTQAPTAARPDYSAVDADVDRLAIKLEEHSHSMIRDVAQLMLGVKQKLLLAQTVAVDGERHVAEQRLAVKQEELGLLGDELLASRADLQWTSRALDRCAQGFASKVQKVKDRTKMLRMWAAWRAYALNRQRLRRKAAQADAWYQHHFLTHCVFEAWHRRARGNYRALALRRHEQNLAAALAEQAAVQERELQALRQQLESAEQRLASEKEARDSLEEDMRRAFMRGVTALNLEAIRVMKPAVSSSSPFPSIRTGAAQEQQSLASAGQPYAQPSQPLQQPGALDGNHANANGYSASTSRSPTPDVLPSFVIAAANNTAAAASTTGATQLPAPDTPPAATASQQQHQPAFSAAAAIRSASTLPAGVRYCAPGVQSGQPSSHQAAQERPAPKVVVTRGPASGTAAGVATSAAASAAVQRGGRNQAATMHPVHPGNYQRKG